MAHTSIFQGGKRAAARNLRQPDLVFGDRATGDRGERFVQGSGAATERLLGRKSRAPRKPGEVGQAALEGRFDLVTPVTGQRRVVERLDQFSSGGSGPGPSAATPANLFRQRG